jgi:hypothetical protein
MRIYWISSLGQWKYGGPISQGLGGGGGGLRTPHPEKTSVLTKYYARVGTRMGSLDD